MAVTYTTNFNLVKHDEGDIDWADDMNSNLDEVDEHINDPESHTHTEQYLDILKMNAAPDQLGTVSFPNVTTADADATYGTAERDLINELKSTVNQLLDALRTSTGCGVLRWETTTTTTTTSSTSSSTSSTSTTTTTTTTV